MNKRIFAKKGFTVAESLFAAAIMAFTAICMLELFINCASWLRKGREISVATGHAQYIMEEIRGTDFTQIKSKADSATWNYDAAGLQAKGLVPISAETVSTSASGTTLLDVSVTVNWQDSAGRSLNTKLETLVTKQ